MTIIFHEQGLSLLFVVALVFSILLRYDAINVRYEAGRHASYLNTIKGELFDVFSRGEHHNHTLNERIGHTLPELLAGIVIGVAVTSFFYLM
ncbi:MAG: divergent PAP2 family protein [Candidatus Peribacteria bacterium]|nr:MAG: divergent PAP2 family protein [Candidatus Peribacteria bacterium]